MTNPMPLSPEAIDRLTADTEPWLSCDDCFDLVDIVIDAMMTSSTPFSDEFRVHLLRCAVCHEEVCSLAEVVAESHGLSPDEAVARVTSALVG